MKIHLGFEVGTGHAVELPLHHLVVCGLTQSSGKTTTLEALITRSGRRAIVFLTKRGEGGFENSHAIRPYFKPKKIDWVYVQSLLESTMKQKMDYKQPWIIRTCEGDPKTLEEVHRNVKRLEENARAGLAKDMYHTLDAYFELVLPEVRRANLSGELKLRDSLNVMHMEHLSAEVQSLVIRSVIEEIYKNYRETIIVVPECWKFIPRGRSTPVKPAINALIREGAVLGNFCFFDSQDIAGIDAGILKSVDIWLLGRQRELNEIKRMVDYMPVRPKPRPDQIATLGIGQFVACFGHEVKTVYVQPTWMSWSDAQSVATGMLPLETAGESKPRQSRREVSSFEDETKEQPAVSLPSLTLPSEKEDEDMSRVQELEFENERLRTEIAGLKEQLSGLSETSHNLLRRLDDSERERGKEPSEERTPKRAPTQENGKVDSIVDEVIDRLKSKPELLKVLLKQPRIEVDYDPVIVKADGFSFRGRVARLIQTGWLDDPRENRDIAFKLTSTGAKVLPANCSRDLKWFVENEFLERDEDKYVAPKQGKGRIT